MKIQRVTERKKPRRMLLAAFLICAMLLGAASAPSAPAFAVGEFDVRVPEFRPAPVDLSNPEVYTGTDEFRNIINRIYYRDIDRVYGKRDIVKLTALKIINLFGEREFRPQDPATGYETLAQLIGLAGAEEAAVRSVQDELGTTTSPERLKLLLNKAYYDEAVRRTIVMPNEMLHLEKPITRERAAAFLARTIAAPKQYLQTTVYTFKDWQKVEPSARPMIETLVAQGIVPLKSDGTFAPKELLTRAELAVWISAAFDRNLPLTGSTVGYALVVGVRTEKKKEAKDAVTEYIATLRTPDGKALEFRTTRDDKSGANDFIFYKDGIITSSRFLEVGDEVEYIVQDGKIRFVGTIPGGQVLSELTTKKDLYFYTHFATVADIRKIDEIRDNRTFHTEIYRVVDMTGDAFDIVVREDGITGVREDIFTYKGNTVGGIRLLQVGDTIEYITNEKMEVGYIKVRNPLKEEISGTMNKIEPMTATTPEYITIFGYDDRLSRFQVAPYATLSINGRSAELKEFEYGLSVRVKVVDGMAVQLIGESYGGEPGYIPPFGKMRIGTVVVKYHDRIRIRTANGVMEEVIIRPTAQVFRAGAVSDLRALKVGESVKVYFNNIVSKEAARVEVQVPERQFARVYKGRLANFVPQSGELHIVGADGISKPEFLTNQDWKQVDGYSKELAIAPNCEIYVDNERLTPEMLERMYKNYDIYAVTEEVFGKETAVRISVRRGAEMTHSGSVTSVNHSIGELQLLTRDNFEITKATIVIKDGLVVPSTQIRANDSVFVAAESPNGAYERNALFVSVTSKKDFLFDSVRIGAIETVSPSSFNLRNHTLLKNNRPDAVNPNVSGNYRLTTNTLIRDISDPENVKTIKPNKFYHNKYGRSENYEKGSGLNYKRYYTFMVVNPANGNVLAMNMRKGGLTAGNLFDYKLKKEEEIATELAKIFKDMVLTRGVVTGRDEVWDRFEITEAHDITSYNNRWVATGTNLFVKHADAIIMKNHTVITADDIRVGDYIYVLRLGSDSLVIYVE